MLDPVRSAAGLIGLAIIGCVAHASAISAGGYASPGMPLLLALAAGLAVGAIAVGTAWRDGRRALAALIGVALLAGEAYALLLTSERVLEAREGKQAPLRAQLTLREQAETRVRAAEAALAATATSVRLERALAAKAAADRAVIEKAAEKGCAVHCRALLEQQVATAAGEVSAARAELAGLQQAAERELGTARAALARMPAPVSDSPLADRLGLPGWQVDLLAAALASLAANGLGAFLLAFAAHGRRGAGEVQGQPTAAVAPVMEPPARDAAAEADAFARATFRPAPGGRIALRDVREAYHAWARSRGLEPLSDLEIGAALAALFAGVGLYREGEGARAGIPGLTWADPAQRPAAGAPSPRPAPLRLTSQRGPRLGRMAARARSSA